ALVGFLALVLGMFLARSSINQILAHLAALAVGGAVVLWQALTVVGGTSVGERVDNLYFRMNLFFDVVRHGGISNDTLPFIIMVVGLTWLGVYFFAWSVFRWHNAWLGLIPAGAGLFANFFYQQGSISFPFILFAFASLLLVMRMNLLRRVRQWRQQGTPYPEFISLSFLHLTSWAALLLLLAAWLVPAGAEAQPFTGLWEQASRPFQGISSDLSRLFVRVRVRQVQPIHGFENILPFKGSIPLRDRVALQVQLDDDFDLGSFPFLYGAAYDEYTAAGWLMGDKVRIDISDEPPEVVAQGIQEDPALANLRLVEAEVTVVGSRRTVLFGVGHPLASSVPAFYVSPKVASDAAARDDLADQENRFPFLPGLALESKKSLRTGATYSVLGTVPNVTAQDLRSASTRYPAWVRQRYLQMPGDLPQRVRDLAQEVTAGAPTPYDAALALEEYLRRNYSISYEPPNVPVGRDAVDFFLFETGEGYFDYYASAMVVMLREVGVPARLAVGFILDPKARANDRFIVRDRHAYAWPEVYFPTIGWVPFNPTPSLPALRGTAFTDTFDPAGIGDVPPVDLFEEVPLEGEDIVGGGGQGLALEESGGGGVPLALWIALAALAAIALAAAGARFAWEHSVAGLPYPQQIWEKTVRLASWARVRPRPNQTPREYVDDVAQLAPDLEDLDLLADTYGRSRFGKQPLAREEQQRLKEAWERLRNKLLARLLRWK
ncbi:MAG: DUF4129 domain-containing transglutaminase family protein, partial [Dehalococcoidia bacterium]